MSATPSASWRAIRQTTWGAGEDVHDDRRDNFHLLSRFQTICNIQPQYGRLQIVVGQRSFAYDVIVGIEPDVANVVTMDLKVMRYFHVFMLISVQIYYGLCVH